MVAIVNLSIDWQSELANHIGDVPTYKLSQLAKNAARKLNFAASQIQADASEYLVHEKRLVVTGDQITSFNEATKHVATHVDELSLRIDRLIDNLSQGLK